ncbi:MAG: RagB/SusD family nutrient uptake outer membrane protein [Candidatus Cryptobacteroides sp.]
MKKIFAILLPAALLCFASCDGDFLNKTPESTISPDSYFKTETDLMMFSNAFYAQFNDSFYESQSDHFINLNLSSELRGGNVRTVPSTGGGWTWTMLRRINDLLGNIDKCPDEAVRAEYAGLAKFFRAFFYFEKVKRFGDVPWVGSSFASDDEGLYAARDSREVIMTHMLEDIDEAIASLPSAKSLYRVNKYAALALKAQFCLYEGSYRRYHSLNLPGHSAEDYFNLAAQAAEEIMAGPYALKDDYLMLFAEENADPDEMILAMQFDRTVQRKNNTTAFATMSTQGAPGLTKKFVDSFLMKDGSRFTDKAGWETMQFIEEVSDRDPRLACLTRTPGYTRIGGTEVLAPDFGSSVTGFQLVKFVMDCTLPEVDRVDKSYNDLPIYRLGEIYLIYAEAKAELGTITQDDLDRSVNLLRKRVGMPDMVLADALASPDPYLLSAEYGYGNPILHNSSNVGILLELRRERSIELAQEGKRWDDLMRWKEGKCIDQVMYGQYFPGPGQYDLTGDGKPDVWLYEGEKPADKTMQLLKIGDKTGVILSEGSYGYVDNQQGIDHIFNEERDYLYPIPIEERQLNPNLTQNPGWNDGLKY